MAKETRPHPIFAKARELAGQIAPAPERIPEGEAARLAFRGTQAPHDAAVRQAFADYVAFANSQLKSFGFTFANVGTMICKRAILQEAAGWPALFGWHFEGLTEAEQAQLLAGWAEGALNGALKDAGR